MVIPILGALAAGIGSGFLFSKKGALIEGGKTFAQNIHQPYETYAPTTSTQTSYVSTPQYAYTVQIESPGAVATTKKEDRLAVEQTARLEPEVSPVSSAAASGPAGVSSTAIMVVAAAVLGVYLLK